MVNKETGLSRGFGFISYETKIEADEAILQMNGFRLGSKRLKVQHKRGSDSPFDIEQETLFDQAWTDPERARSFIYEQPSYGPVVNQASFPPRYGGAQTFPQGRLSQGFSDRPPEPDGVRKWG